MEDAGYCEDRLGAVPALKTVVVLVMNVVAGPVIVIVVVLVVTDFAIMSYIGLPGIEESEDEVAFLSKVVEDAIVELRELMECEGRRIGQVVVVRGLGCAEYVVMLVASELAGGVAQLPAVVEPLDVKLELIPAVVETRDVKLELVGITGIWSPY